MPFSLSSTLRESGSCCSERSKQVPMWWLFSTSLASAEDALLAGALVWCAEANEKPCLLIFLLLLQTVVRLPFRRFATQVWAWSWFQTQFLLYHLRGDGIKQNKKVQGCRTFQTSRCTLHHSLCGKHYVPVLQVLSGCPFSQPLQSPATSRCCYGTPNRAEQGSGPSSPRCSFLPEKKVKNNHFTILK